MLGCRPQHIPAVQHHMAPPNSIAAMEPLASTVLQNMLSRPVCRHALGLVLANMLRLQPIMLLILIISSSSSRRAVSQAATTAAPASRQGLSRHTHKLVFLTARGQEKRLALSARAPAASASRPHLRAMLSAAAAAAASPRQAPHPPAQIAILGPGNMEQADGQLRGPGMTAVSLPTLRLLMGKLLCM